MSEKEWFADLVERTKHLEPSGPLAVPFTPGTLGAMISRCEFGWSRPVCRETTEDAARRAEPIAIRIDGMCAAPIMRASAPDGRRAWVPMPDCGFGDLLTEAPQDDDEDELRDIEELAK